MRIRKDFVGLLFLVTLAAVNYWHLIPRQVVAEGSDPAYPLLLNGILFGLAIFYAFEIVRSFLRGGGTLAVLHVNWRATGKVALLLCAIGGWAYAMNMYGFIPCTTVFLAVGAWLYGERSIPKILSLILISPLALYIVFTLFGSYLPQGPLEQLLGRFLVS